MKSCSPEEAFVKKMLAHHVVADAHGIYMTMWGKLAIGDKAIGMDRITGHVKYETYVQSLDLLLPAGTRVSLIMPDWRTVEVIEYIDYPEGYLQQP